MIKSYGSAAAEPLLALSAPATQDCNQRISSQRGGVDVFWRALKVTRKKRKLLGPNRGRICIMLAESSGNGTTKHRPNKTT